jgi:hypothetical protein
MDENRTKQNRTKAQALLSRLLQLQATYYARVRVCASTGVNPNPNPNPNPNQS